jgi:hypothetical protein
MPDQQGDNEEDIVGLDWLTSQLSDDDEETADDETADEAAEPDGASGPADSADTVEEIAFESSSQSDDDDAPTVAMNVVPDASSRELRFSSTPAEPESDSAEPATAEQPPAEVFPSRAERIEAQRAEADRIEAERVEAERVIAIRAAAERAAAEEAAEAERVETERLEAERVATEGVEAERLEAERVENERVEVERVEAERLEAERVEAERLETERVEVERVENERLETERVETERVKAERLETERVEAERVEKERLETERRGAERVEAERAESERARVESVGAATVAAVPAVPAVAADDAEPPATKAVPPLAADDASADDADETDDDPDAEPVFLWGLTPTIEPDPVVESRRAQEKTGLTAEPAAQTETSPPAGVPSAAPATPVISGSTPPPPVSAASVPAASGPPEPTEPLTKPPFTARRPLSDPEAAPWWTTPAQARLVPTADEATAAERRRIAGAQDTAPSGQPTGAPDVAEVPLTPAEPDARSTTPVVSAAAAVRPAAGDDAPIPLAPASAQNGADDARRSGDAGDAGAPPEGPKNRALAWAATAVVTILVLIGLFFLSQSLGDSPAAAPVATESEAASPSVEPAPTPEPVPEPTAPQPAGVHAWNTMFGSECLGPYTSPWDEEFTVVDCGAPHAAQLVYRGILEGESGSPFPGEQAFADQINVLCSAPGVIDFGAAAAYDDLQLQGSYPVTAEQWDNGDRYFYCFASRSTGEPLNTSLAPVA